MSQLTIRANPVVLVGLTFGFVFLFLAPLAGIGAWESGRHESVLDLLTLLGPIVLLGTMLLRLRALAVLVRLAISGQPIVTIGQNGVFDYRSMRKAIPWTGIAGINYGSGGMFGNIKIVLTEGHSLGEYLKTAPVSILQDIVYECSTFGLRVNEFQLDEVTSTYLTKPKVR